MALENSRDLLISSLQTLKLYLGQRTPPLDDSENSNMVIIVNQVSDHANYADTSNEKDNKCAMKKVKERYLGMAHTYY